MKPLLLAGVLMLVAGTTRAQISLNLDDCSTGPSNHASTFACASNSGTVMTAYCSVVVPPVTRVGFFAATAVLDGASSSLKMPSWWDSNSCRPSAFVVAADPAMGGSCRTLWDAVPGTGVWLSSLFRFYGSDRVRFVLTQMLPEADAYDLTGDGTTELSVFKFTVLADKTVGLGSCAGCATGVCFNLNEINLIRITDTPDTYLRLTGPFTGASTYVTFQSGGPSCPAATPTLNRSWGAVKAQYR